MGRFKIGDIVETFVFPWEENNPLVVIEEEHECHCGCGAKTITCKDKVGNTYEEIEMAFHFPEDPFFAYRGSFLINGITYRLENCYIWNITPRKDYVVIKNAKLNTTIMCYSKENVMSSIDDHMELLVNEYLNVPDECLDSDELDFKNKLVEILKRVENPGFI